MGEEGGDDDDDRPSMDDGKRAGQQPVLLDENGNKWWVGRNICNSRSMNISLLEIVTKIYHEYSHRSVINSTKS
jgi:hypothetical protein